MSDLFYTERDLADLLGYSPRTLSNWRVRRIGPPYIKLPGKKPLYPRGSTLEWLEARRVQTEDAA